MCPASARFLSRVATSTAELERALAGFDRPARAASLAAALGFASLDPRPDGPGPAEGRADGRAWSIAERAGMRLTLVQLDGQVSARATAAWARSIAGRDATAQHLVLFADARYRTVGLTASGLDGVLRDLVLQRQQPRPTDLETLAEMVARPGEGGVALAIRYARALDRARVGRRFFLEFRAHRTRVATGWTNIPRRLRAEREQLALLHLCRLMFLYFLQRQGHLAGDPAFLPGLLRRWQRQPRIGTTFHRDVLVPLFFGALNTRPERRTAAARALGPLPYLNGGLFERTRLEQRFDGLDLADEVSAALFEELLERYRFTARDHADDIVDGAFAAGIDPEMLGRVFEGMMAEDRRGDTGTFFTPPAVVDRLVTRALSAHLAARTGLTDAMLDRLMRTRSRDVADARARQRLARAAAGLRVLDPACGSGAFLLGALSRIAALRATLDVRHDGDALRRDIVTRGIYGVDIQGDAALLCALRLWLALSVPAAGRVVDPLPNLDRRIRQGDALLDPLDLAMPGTRAHVVDRGAAIDARVRAAVRALTPASTRYIAADPDERSHLLKDLADGEARLAAAWIDAIEHRLAGQLAEARARAAERDLWQQPSTAARAAASAIGRIETRTADTARIRRALEDGRALPFFSFGVHFADAALHGFDLVVSNPPWIRAHRWPAALASAVRSRYAVCRSPGWRAGTRLAGAPRAAAAQIDLSLLFLERVLALLAPHGTLGMLMPAKILRSLYGGSARRMLLRDTAISSVEDHSLDQRSIFRADAFAAAIVATRGAPATRVRVCMIRRGRRPRAFRIPQNELPLFPDDIESPWLIAPRRVTRVFRTMQAAGPLLGLHTGLRVRRGIFTGANDVLVLERVTARLGDLATVRATGWSARGDRHRSHDRSRGEDPSNGARTAERDRYEALVEASAIRPLLRGSDVGPWAWTRELWVVWTHGDGALAHQPPRRLRAYLQRHADRLDRRSGLRSSDPPGRLFRVTPDALGHKVVWHDLAATLNAVAVPAVTRTPFGWLPIVPLNSVYFVPVRNRRDALLLAAFFNALPVRTFARAIAERAKDARFRFFAWTIGALPLPADWRTAAWTDRLASLSDAAHTAGAAAPVAQQEMDSIVARAYGLDARAVRTLQSFAGWLG